MFSLAHLATCLWIRNNETLSRSAVNDFVSALYFLITTAATVGYGDITVSHVSLNNVGGRFVFASSLMIFALIFFAYVQSLINSMLQDFQAVEIKVRKKLDEFEDWMTVRNMTTGVVIHYRYEKNLKEFFEYLYKYDVYSAIGAEGYLELMRFCHQEYIYESATEYVAAHFAFFEELGQSLRQKIILSLSPVW